MPFRAARMRFASDGFRRTSTSTRNDKTSFRFGFIDFYRSIKSLKVIERFFVDFLISVLLLVLNFNSIERGAEKLKSG